MKKDTRIYASAEAMVLGALEIERTGTPLDAVVARFGRLMIPSYMEAADREKARSDADPELFLDGVIAVLASIAAHAIVTCTDDAGGHNANAMAVINYMHELVMDGLASYGGDDATD